MGGTSYPVPCDLFQRLPKVHANADLPEPYRDCIAPREWLFR